MPRIILGVLVRCRRARFLDRWLEAALRLADHIVIIDETCDRGWAERCRGAHGRVTVHRLTEIVFYLAPALQEKVWESVRAVAAPGDWVGLLEGDEVPSEPLIAAAGAIRALPPHVERLDAHFVRMWDERSFRVDGAWSGWSPLFVRFRDEPFLSTLPDGPDLEALRMPQYAESLVPLPLDAPVLHLDLSRPEAREAKASRPISARESTTPTVAR